jgi:RNA polymerase sigma-70 factor (ECF subfamily)
VASFADTSGHAGDERNFEALYETYRLDVQRLASYLLRNATDAEDAAQTVFLNVLRALRQGVTPADPRAWLLAITRNVCFSRKRALSARPLQVELEPELVSSEPDGDAGPSADEIVGALTRLLPNQRTALILRDFRGVSRPEIAQLMSITPVALEALLTRARAAFREELEAGEQPFACAETRDLVERQLDGLITVADRHSLRTHLRHCASCSTLARAVRSSRGKLAALLFWPGELISRLAAAFTQAPAAVHVAAALTSTAAIATVAIPVAISPSSPARHVEGRTAPGPAVAAAPRIAPAFTPSRTVTHLISNAASTKPSMHKAAVTHKNAVAHRANHATVTKSVKPVAHAGKAPVATHAATTTAPTTSSGGIQTPVYHTAGSTAAPTTAPHPAINLPSNTAPTRSTSPIVRPTSKPKAKPKSKPSRKAPKKHARHAPSPVQQMPASSPPAADMAPPDGGAVDGAGSGVVVGTSSSPAIAPASTSSGGGSTSASSTGTSTSSQGNDGNGNNGKGDNGNGDHHKHKK